MVMAYSHWAKVLLKTSNIGTKEIGINCVYDFEMVSSGKGGTGDFSDLKFALEAYIYVTS